MKASVFSLLALLLLSAALVSAEEPAAEPEAEPEPVAGEPKAEALGQDKEDAAMEPNAEPEPDSEGEHTEGPQTEDPHAEGEAEPEPEPEHDHDHIMPEKQSKAESAGTAASQQLNNDDSGSRSLTASLAIVVSSIIALTAF